MKTRLALFFFAACICCMAANAANPKREFRGAWLHTIGQSQYASQTTEQNKEYLRDQLDKLQQAGVNAVLFQVRPAADALYDSKLELWSKYLTKDGAAPVPYWDPLQFIIEEAHARGMELHAWLNPYRVTTTVGETLPKGHLYHREPERFVKYQGDGKIYFDPALPQNRQHIANVVADIVERYDVDGIHFDDYFYPYPAKGVGKNKAKTNYDFPDSKSYAKYGHGADRGDWRRKNVDMLIELIHNTIRQSSKPWVRFGVSPFGIWRNKSADPRGSNTHGLQNYDDLYADVLLWAENGWIDYLLPQLYWELEHPAASYLALIDWWAQAVDPKCQLYIGQDVERTMSKPDIEPGCEPNQLAHKVGLARKAPTIQGNCWWPGYSLTRNSRESATLLSSTFQSTPALVPAYPQLAQSVPNPVCDFSLADGTLRWSAPSSDSKTGEAVKYVVYRFGLDSDQDYDDASNIIAITPATSFPATEPGIYAVTAIDHANLESNPSPTITIR